MTNLDDLHEQLRTLVGPDTPFVLVVVDPDEPPTDDSGIGSAGAAIIVQGMTALQVAATLSQLTTACLRDDLEHLDPGSLNVSYPPDSTTTVPGPPGADRGQQPVADSLPHGLPTRGTPDHATLEDLLRRIEDAIDAHLDVRTRGYESCGCRTLDGRHGPAVVRAVLEATLPDVDVCPDCRGIGHRIVEGERSASWCRPCNGIGYVDR